MSRGRDSIINFVVVVILIGSRSTVDFRMSTQRIRSAKIGILGSVPPFKYSRVHDTVTSAAHLSPPYVSVWLSPFGRWQIIIKFFECLGLKAIFVRNL